MKNAIDLIKKLKKKSPSWKDLMINFLDGEIEDTDDLYNDVFSIFYEIREIYKTTENIPESISKELDDSELVTMISDHIKNSLVLYFDLSLLRDLQKDYTDIAKNLVSIIMEEFIFHTGIDGNGRIQKLLEPTSMYDEKAVNGTISALAHFTQISIINNLTNEGIKTNIEVEGSLSEKISTMIADLIWRNRIELKMDYIIQQIGDIDLL